jgi:hypothetical protein
MTKAQAEQNKAMYTAAISALREVGWMPEPEPRNWMVLAENATYLVLRQFPPNVTFDRARHQVLKVMVGYRGYKQAEW